MEFLAWILVSAIFMVSRVASTDSSTCPSSTVSLYVNSTGIQFSSPVYPGYPTSSLSTTCRWRVRPTHSMYVVAFEFIHANLDESTDCEKVSVAFYDGTSYNSPLIKKVCGSDLPTRLSTTTAYMFIEFKVTGEPKGQGFMGRAYMIVPPSTTPEPPSTTLKPTTTAPPSSASTSEGSTSVGSSSGSSSSGSTSGSSTSSSTDASGTTTTTTTTICSSGSTVTTTTKTNFNETCSP